MKVKFNIFLLKYLLSEDLVNHFANHPEIKNARFAPTILPQYPNKFYANINASDAESYAMFGHEVVRVEITDVNDITTVFYLFFRNGRQNRPDLGTNKYDFTRPSSVEIGSMNSHGAYDSFYKKHYIDWITNPDLEFNTLGERNQKIKDIEYDILNAIINEYNTLTNNHITLKPVNAAGQAVFTPKQPQQSVAQNNNGMNANVASLIHKIIK